MNRHDCIEKATGPTLVLPVLDKLLPIRRVPENDAQAVQAILDFKAGLGRCASAMTKMILLRSTRSEVTGVSTAGTRPAEATFRALAASYALS